MRLSKSSCRCVVAVVTAMGAAIACRDSTAPPKDPLVIAIGLVSEPTFIIADTPDGPIITCDVEFVARATGTGTATWEDATFYWYFGGNRVAPVDSASVSADEIQDSWENAAIVANEAQLANWQFSAGAPFEVRADFQYLADDGSTPATATTRFTCGPLPTAGPPPTITQVTPPSGASELQPGDSFTVAFSAGASQGLWVSGVVVEGPFEAERVFSERLAVSTTRSATFTVPTGVTLGVPLSIAVFAVDISLQQVVRIVPTQVRVIDRAPPTISVAFLRGGTGGLAGQFGVGDSLDLRVSASDNNALAWLIYSLGAPANVRDSVAAPPSKPAHGWDLKIPIRPEWVGAPVLSLQVRDHAGLTSEIRSSQPDSLRFYPTVSYPVTSAMDLPSVPGRLGDMGDVSYDAQRKLFYVAQPHDSQIAVLAVETMTFAPSIRLPSVPAGIDLSPGGDSLIVALPDTRSLAVVHLRQPSVPIEMIPLTVLDTAGGIPADATPRPYGLRVASTGVAIVMLSTSTRSRDQTVSVDLRTGEQRIRADANGTSNIALGSTERTADHSRIVILARVCSRTYLAASDAFTSCGQGVSVSAGFFPTFDAAAARLTYRNVILDAQFNEIYIARSSALAITLDGAFVFEGTDGFVRKVRTADGVVVERFAVPLPAEQLFVTPDGKWLLAFHRAYTGRVARVDLR